MLLPLCKIPCLWKSRQPRQPQYYSRLICLFRVSLLFARPPGSPSVHLISCFHFVLLTLDPRHIFQVATVSLDFPQMLSNRCTTQTNRHIYLCLRVHTASSKRLPILSQAFKCLLAKPPCSAHFLIAPNTRDGDEARSAALFHPNKTQEFYPSLLLLSCFPYTTCVVSGRECDWIYGYWLRELLDVSLRKCVHLGDVSSFTSAIRPFGLSSRFIGSDRAFI